MQLELGDVLLTLGELVGDEFALEIVLVTPEEVETEEAVDEEKAAVVLVAPVV